MNAQNIYIIADERIGNTCYFANENAFNAWFAENYPDADIPDDLEAWDAELYREETDSAIYMVEFPHNTGYGRYETMREYYRVWPTNDVIGEAQYVEIDDDDDDDENF